MTAASGIITQRMHRLSLQDTSFLRMESRRTPMHVGVLLTFQLPAAAGPGFLQDLFEDLRRRPFMPFPFDHKLSRGLRPGWVAATIDIDHHLRRSALPYPGSERELGILVERLHSQPLDLNRPLWELHIIEGLEHGRFALYMKAHHAAIDGQGAMKLLRGWLSDEPADPAGLYGIDRGNAPRPRPASRRPSSMTMLLRQLRALPDLATLLRRISAKNMEGGLRGSLNVPRTLFNQPVTQQRRVGTQILALQRLKAVATATGTTVNDVILSLCGGAMRRYLQEQQALPDKTLYASVPVGRAHRDGESGNAASGFVCPLATDEADPLARLQRIAAVTRQGKQLFQTTSPEAVGQYSLLGLAPLVLGQMTGTLARLPPLFNVTISNVVISKTPLYLRGAELEGMYPIGFLLDGYALIITLVGYCDRVSLGFVGCRDRIPHLQRLAVYTGEALAELETALQLTALDSRSDAIAPDRTRHDPPMFVPGEYPASRLSR